MWLDASAAENIHLTRNTLKQAPPIRGFGLYEKGAIRIQQDVTFCGLIRLCCEGCSRPYRLSQRNMCIDLQQLSALLMSVIGTKL